MSAPKHFNTKAGSPPYKGRFSNVTIIPPNTTLAYISTQWAADPATEGVVPGCEGDVGKQATIIWTNLVAMLKELGAEMKDVVHRTVSYKEFNEELGKASVQGSMAALPDEWKPHFLSSSLEFRGVAFFHHPDIAITVDLVVALPNHK